MAQHKARIANVRVAMMFVRALQVRLASLKRCRRS